jgi:hypothetical protein
MKYKVSYWTIVEADNEEEAKEGFAENIDDNSIDVEEVTK